MATPLLIYAPRRSLALVVKHGDMCSHGLPRIKKNLGAWTPQPPLHQKATPPPIATQPPMVACQPASEPLNEVLPVPLIDPSRGGGGGGAGGTIACHLNATRKMDLCLHFHVRGCLPLKRRGPTPLFGGLGLLALHGRDTRPRMHQGCLLVQPNNIEGAHEAAMRWPRPRIGPIGRAQALQLPSQLHLSYQ